MEKLGSSGSSETEAWGDGETAQEDDSGSSEEEVRDEETDVDSSSKEDEGPKNGDRHHLWTYEMKDVSFILSAFQRAYVDLLSGSNLVWRFRHREVQGCPLVSRSEQERIHDCVREIRKLWNKTARICVRKRICEVGKVNWDVHRRLRTAQVYDLAWTG